MTRGPVLQEVIQGLRPNRLKVTERKSFQAIYSSISEMTNGKGPGSQTANSEAEPGKYRFYPADLVAGTEAGIEEARISALEDLDLLNTPESESFDRITRMASQLFQTPISAVSLTDRHRQWFKSHVGTQGREIPREGAPCAAVTMSGAPIIIPDLLTSPQFADSLLAKSGVRFYAGSPLKTRDGHVLGAMCVLDSEPREITQNQVASLNDLAAMVMSQIELEHDFGRIDPLSGLPNRNQFSEDLEDEKRQHPDRAYVVLLVDPVDPNQLCDSVNVLGTGYLDDLVRNSTRIIKKVLDRKRGIYHVGTTSFAILLNQNEGAWQDVVEKLLNNLRGQVLSEGIPVTTHPVFGVAPFCIAETRLADVLRTAFTAANDARRLEIPYAVYSPDSDNANLRRFTLLNDIRTALEGDDQLALVYQPRIDLRTGVCVSAEALLRWNHPVFGPVSPAEFIPLIEQTALAEPVTKWVLNCALRQLSQWRKANSDVRVSINISARNLEEPHFAAELNNLLRKHGVDITAIELEFTESALIRNRSRVITQLEMIRAMNVELAIDDFGTGYSSFSYLNKLPATTIKIDRSFIGTLVQSSVEEKLVRSMITMAHDIGYRAVAEGVETAEVYRMLAEAGCDEVQGYFISRPLAAHLFERWLKEQGDAKIISTLQLLSSSSNSSPYDN